LNQVQNGNLNINGFISTPKTSKSNVAVIEDGQSSDPSIYVPMNATGLEYADAYKQLQQGLNEFSVQANGDKKILSQIDNIKRTVNTDTTVKPASKEIQQAKAISDDIVNAKEKEVNDLANQVKNYDKFIDTVKKDQIQLVSEKENFQTTISTPLITMNETTKNMIASQESPTQTYIALNKTLVQ